MRTDRIWALRTPFDREIAVLGIPALGALVADPLLSLVDTAFVGRLGGDALGALGVSSAVFAVAFFAFNFLEYGTTSLVARAVGAGDVQRAGRATVSAFVLALGLGVLAAVLLEVLLGPILGVMGATGGVKAEATTYLRIRALAIPAVLVIRAGHGSYRGYQDTRTPLIVTLGVNAVNLVLDPVLIFGAGWDIAGAAWATVIAQWVGAVWFVVGVARRRARLGITVLRTRFDELLAFLAVGRALAIRSASLLAAFTVATAVATRVGDDAVAGHQVVMQLFIFLALGVDALAIAAQAMVGRRAGAGDVEEGRFISDRLVVMGMAVGLALAAVLAAIAGPLPGWFTDDPAVIAEIRSIYWFLVVLQPLAAVVFVWDGVFLGLADFAFLAGAMFLSAVVTCVVLLAVLPLGWPLTGVWWGMIVLIVTRLLTLAWRRATPAGPLAR
ncbi:MAG TPA: MATE family efflux transporter [Acidimicrobiia bacterium]|nr:MATE family efflux transporter [Acidimicrobiia bacterium]